MSNKKLCFYKMTFSVLLTCCFITYSQGAEITGIVSCVKRELEIFTGFSEPLSSSAYKQSSTQEREKPIWYLLMLFRTLTVLGAGTLSSCVFSNL